MREHVLLFCLLGLALIATMLFVALLAPTAHADPIDAPRYNPSSDYLDRKYESTYDYERKLPRSYDGKLLPEGCGFACDRRGGGPGPVLRRRPGPFER